MQYRVIAKKRSGFDGFRRSGRFFSSEHEAILEEEEMTDAIRNEPLLHVIPVSEDEADNIDAQTKIAELTAELERRVAEANERDGLIVNHVREIESERDRHKEDSETASTLIEALQAEKVKFEGESEELKVRLADALTEIEELKSRLEPPPGENDLPETLKDKLSAAGYDTKAKLDAATDEELLAVEGIGKKTVEIIRASLNRLPNDSDLDSGIPPGDQLP